jgi:hypothetical protein
LNPIAAIGSGSGRDGDLQLLSIRDGRARHCRAAISIGALSRVPGVKRAGIFT